MKLNKSLVLNGIGYRTEVYLPAYDATVEVRPLSDIEFSACREDANIFTMLNALGVSAKDVQGKSPEELKNMISEDNIKFDDLDANLNALYTAAAKRGIVDPELKTLVDNPNKELPDEPEKVMLFTLLRGGSIELIGSKIMEITTTKPGDVANFSNPRTESNSSSSTQPVTS